MRLAIIADTHLPRGARRLPDECVRRLEKVDLILHAGDFVRLEALRELERFAPVAGVCGNMDEPAVQRLLPERRVVEADDVRIGMIHVPGRAAGRGERLAAMFPECDAVVYGHTHVPEVERRGDCWLLNPGSPTERRRAPSRAMLVAEVGAGTLVPELVRLSP